MSLSKSFYVIPLSLPGPLLISPAPPGGCDLAGALRALRTRKVSTVVSLIEPHEVVALDLLREGELFESQGGQFIPFPIADQGTPRDEGAFIELAESLIKTLAAGDGVCIHCWGGIGRSGLLACTIGCLAGGTLATIKATVGEARGAAVPESIAQHAWLDERFGPPARRRC